MVEVIAKAASIPLFTESMEPFTPRMERKHIAIIGGTHLVALKPLFEKYAAEASILIPSTISCLDMETETERAIEFENLHGKLCKGIVLSRDLTVFDTDSIDCLFVCTLYPEVRDAMLAQAWRAVKELGKVIIFTNCEIPISHLSALGVSAPTYYPAEGFYSGTLRKSAAIRARN